MNSKPFPNNVSLLDESARPASLGVMAQIVHSAPVRNTAPPASDKQRETDSRGSLAWSRIPGAFLQLAGDVSQGRPLEPDLVKTMLEKGAIEALTAREALIFERHIPQSGQWIAGVIGMPLTVLLVSKLGGHVLYMHGKDLQVLIDLLGNEAVAKLKKQIGGQTLGVPLCSAGTKAVTHFRIREEFDSLTAVGLSARKAVRHLTYMASPPIHERTVWRILKGTDEPVKRIPRKYRDVFEPSSSGVLKHRCK